MTMMMESNWVALVLGLMCPKNHGPSVRWRFGSGPNPTFCRVNMSKPSIGVSNDAEGGRTLGRSRLSCVSLGPGQRKSTYIETITW